MTLILTSTFSICYIIYFILFRGGGGSLLTGVYGHVGHHILHKEDKNKRRNTDLTYDPKEDGFLIYFPLYVKHLEEYTKTPCPQGISTEYVTVDQVWGFLFYQAHWDKRKQGGRLKASETRISTSNFYTKDCVALLRRIFMGTT